MRSIRAPMFTSSASAITSAVIKGVEIGAGFSCAGATGSENNDAFLDIRDGHAHAASDASFPGIKRGLASRFSIRVSREVGVS